MDEIVQLKKDKDVMEREISKRDSQLMDAKSELDKSATALKNADLKMETLRSQVDSHCHFHGMFDVHLFMMILFLPAFDLLRSAGTTN